MASESANPTEITSEWLTEFAKISDKVVKGVSRHERILEYLGEESYDAITAWEDFPPDQQESDLDDKTRLKKGEYKAIRNTALKLLRKDESSPTTTSAPNATATLGEDEDTKEEDTKEEEKMEEEFEPTFSYFDEYMQHEEGEPEEVFEPTEPETKQEEIEETEFGQEIKTKLSDAIVKKTFFDPSELTDEERQVCQQRIGYCPPNILSQEFIAQLGNKHYELAVTKAFLREFGMQINRCVSNICASLSLMNFAQNLLVLALKRLGDEAQDKHKIVDCSMAINDEIGNFVQRSDLIVDGIAAVMRKLGEAITLLEYDASVEVIAATLQEITTLVDDRVCAVEEQTTRVLCPIQDAQRFVLSNLSEEDYEKLIKETHTAWQVALSEYQDAKREHMREILPWQLAKVAAEARRNAAQMKLDRATSEYNRATSRHTDLTDKLKQVESAIATKSQETFEIVEITVDEIKIPSRPTVSGVAPRVTIPALPELTMPSVPTSSEPFDKEKHIREEIDRQEKNLNDSINRLTKQDDDLVKAIAEFRKKSESASDGSRTVYKKYESSWFWGLFSSESYSSETVRDGYNEKERLMKMAQQCEEEAIRLRGERQILVDQKNEVANKVRQQANELEEENRKRQEDRLTRMNSARQSQEDWKARYQATEVERRQAELQRQLDMKFDALQTYSEIQQENMKAQVAAQMDARRQAAELRKNQIDGIVNRLTNQQTKLTFAVGAALSAQAEKEKSCSKLDGTVAKEISTVNQMEVKIREAPSGRELKAKTNLEREKHNKYIEATNKLKRRLRKYDLESQEDLFALLRVITFLEGVLRALPQAVRMLSACFNGVHASLTSDRFGSAFGKLPPRQKRRFLEDQTERMNAVCEVAWTVLQAPAKHLMMKPLVDSLQSQSGAGKQQKEIEASSGVVIEEVE